MQYKLVLYSHMDAETQHGKETTTLNCLQSRVAVAVFWNALWTHHNAYERKKKPKHFYFINKKTTPQPHNNNLSRCLTK